VDQLASLAPDLIALQEVSLKDKISTAHWIAAELNRQTRAPAREYQVYLSPKTGQEAKREAIAVLSRLPVKRHQTIDLESQNRVAELVELRLEDRPLLLANGHFYWQHGESKARQEQVERLLNFLDEQAADIPVIVAGDFNSKPGMASVERMRRYFDSAHRAVHGEEPAFTCPTPLPYSRLEEMRVRFLHRLGRNSYAAPTWRGTVDYIFVDPRLETLDCRVVLDQPDEANPRLYPSDHYGLYALIKVN
jgi:endonuclease/exonuclease/phosphatase family metal-dependent hydrolase